MEKLLEILSSINGDVDFRTAEGIIDDELIDSIDFTSLISELEDTFGIEIGMDNIIPDNFNTVEAMWNLITRLQE
jgi:acyl carrier protein